MHKQKFLPEQKTSRPDFSFVLRVNPPYMKTNPTVRYKNLAIIEKKYYLQLGMQAITGENYFR